MRDVKPDHERRQRIRDAMCSMGTSNEHPWSLRGTENKDARASQAAANLRLLGFGLIVIMLILELRSAVAQQAVESANRAQTE